MAREAGARASRSHRLGLPLAVCGALLILVAVCLRAFFPHEGEVFLRDAVVVRADSSRGIPVISDAAQHAAGDEMVAFVRRGQQAEIAALQLKRERIDNDAARLAEALMLMLETLETFDSDLSIVTATSGVAAISLHAD